MNEKVFKYTLLGATDEALADFLDVTVQTLHTWADRHPEFLEARKAGKEAADAEVVKSLYQRALGYSCEEEKVFLHKGEPVVVKVTRNYPPDTAAAFIWLKNRQGWRDKQQVEHTGTVELSEMSDTELVERAQAFFGNRMPAGLLTNGDGG